MSMGCIALFHNLGYFKSTAHSMMSNIWMTSLMATLVEALPIYGWLDDNLTVPITASIVGQLLMPALSG